MGAAEAESSQRIDGAGTRRRQADHQRRYPYAAVGWPLARLSARIRPYTTIYNRFNRWAKRGRWRAIFVRRVQAGEPGQRVIEREPVNARRGVHVREFELSRVCT